MNSVIAVAALFIIPLVENAEKSEITWTYYKKRCPTIHRGSWIKYTIADLLTCSLHCQGDHACCSFFFNISSLTFVPQDVFTLPFSQTCNGSGVWYVKQTQVADKTCLEKHSGTDKAETKPSIKQQESTVDILHTTQASLQNMTLHQACEMGRLNEVKYILSTGLEDINCQDNKGFTPVMVAARKGQDAVFNFLVRRGCDLSLVTNASNNVLHMACEGGDADIVKTLIDEHKLDIDCRGYIGWTPVLVAAYCGNREIIDLLVRKGCNLTVVNDHKDSLLHVACLGGYADVVEYIITQNIISLESRGNDGQTPVLSAVEMGHVEVVTLLQSKGCQMTVTNDWKRNILHEACLGGHVDMVKHILKENIVGIDSRDGWGQTPVIIAVVKGHIGVADLLKSEGCNWRAVTPDGNNLLHVACVGGHVDMVQHILKQNISGIESRGFNGKTPVLIAAGQGHVIVVELLRSKGCNMRVVDNHKSNILHSACMGGHTDMVKYILELNVVALESRGYNGETAIIVAAKMGHVGVFDFLRSKGCNLRAVNQDGSNILYGASYGGHVQMVKHIIKLKVVKIESRGFKRATAVLVASEMGHVGVVDLLRSKGCDMGAVDRYTNTILHCACFRGHVDMVRYILNLNLTDIESRGYGGRSAVLMAAREGLVRVVDLLKTKGCNMTVVDDAGNNILHVACFGGHVNMVRYLLRLDIVSRGSVNKSGMTPVDVARVKGHGKVVSLLKAGKL